jgi:hypothetical protein
MWRAVSKELVGQATVGASLPGVIFPRHGKVRAEDLRVSPRHECHIVEKGVSRGRFFFFVDVAECIRRAKQGGGCWVWQNSRAEGVGGEQG